MNKPILKIKNLKKVYHDTENEVLAIKDIDLEVYNNEFISIVGPSGCGKSTFLSILSKLEDKSGGEVEFSKKDFKIGYMLQKDSLFPWRTVLDNCLIGLEISGNLNEDTKKRVIELLDTYGLGDFKNKYPASLSGGMRQRVP